MDIVCPKCGQRYELDKQYEGQKVGCQVCKTEFIAKESFNSGTPPMRPVQDETEQKEVKTNVKQGALIGAWVCLVIGLLLNIITNFLFFVYVPLYLAAFILAIVAMAQKRVLGGLIALLLCVLLPPAIFFLNIGRFANEMKNAKIGQEEQKEQSTTNKETVKEPVKNQPDKPSEKSEKSAKKNIINGLCGITFGSVHKKNNHEKNGKLTSGEIMYFVDPPKKFMGFDRYYVMITPTTNRIYSIWMIKDFSNPAEASSEFEKVGAVLENHYKIKGEQGMFSIDPMKNFRFDNGNILLKCDKGFDSATIEIRAYSKEFEDLNEKETKDTAINNTDTSAL